MLVRLPDALGGGRTFLIALYSAFHDIVSRISQSKMEAL